MSVDAVALSDTGLETLGERGVEIPGYDRDVLRPRIAHIGVGGFHRAHLAIYCDDLARTGSGWGIRGIGLLPGDAAMAEALERQDHLYSFTEKGSVGDEIVRSTRVIGSIVDFVLATDDPADSAVDALSDAETSIISMTVTEAGYDDTERNQRTFRVIVDGLRRRRDAGTGGVTIMSCDNLPGNGDAARRCVLGAAERVGDHTMARWIESECSFPNSMVDRITPVTSDTDREYLVASHGLVDLWPVVGEPFRQWVIEDRFVDGRPDVVAAGALISDDVHAWELYKLRILNAGHSSIAYLSALAGIEFVDEALATPEIGRFLRVLLHDEAVPALEEIDGHPASAYASTVVERFSNLGVRDQIARLCVDGTSKFPTFLMPTIERQLDLGGSVRCAAHALAGWAHYLASVPDDVRAPDALVERSRPLAVAATRDPAAFVDPRAGFPPSISTSERFVSEFVDAHRAIDRHGPLGALSSMM